MTRGDGGGGAGAGALNMESVVYERAELRMFVPSYETSTQAHVAVAIVQTRRSQFGRSSGPILRDSNLSRLLWTVSVGAFHGKPSMQAYTDARARTRARGYGASTSRISLSPNEPGTVAKNAVRGMLYCLCMEHVRRHGHTLSRAVQPEKSIIDLIPAGCALFP